MMYVPQRYLRAAARADPQEDTLPQRFRRLSQRTRSIGHFVLHAGPALRTAPVCTRARVARFVVDNPVSMYQIECKLF